MHCLFEYEWEEIDAALQDRGERGRTRAATPQRTPEGGSTGDDLLMKQINRITETVQEPEPGLNCATVIQFLYQRREVRC